MTYSGSVMCCCVWCLAKNDSNTMLIGWGEGKCLGGEGKEGWCNRTTVASSTL